MKQWFLKNWLKWRVSWSNFKNKGSITEIEVEENLNKKALLTSLRNLAKEVYSKFTWTMDSIDELFDRMRTPAVCYADYKRGSLNDDCDGFHAVLMQILQANGLDCALLTYMVPDLNECHTILVLKYSTSYYKIDYTSVTKFASLDAIIEKIREKHPDLIAYNLVKFDGSYYIVNSL